MKKIYTTFILGFFAFRAMACDVLPGQLEIKDYPNNVVKIWLSERPANECFPTDSASLRIKFVCRNGQHTKEEIALTDTLIYEISGETSIGFSVIWWRNGKQVGRTDAEPQTMGMGNGLCFKRLAIVVASAGEPYISTENPPPTPYEISFGGDFLFVNAPWPGQIRVFDQMGVLVSFHEFLEGFSFNLNEVASPGHFYYVNVLLFRPQSEGGLISETFTAWLH